MFREVGCGDWCVLCETFGAHITRMPFVMEEHESTNPADAGLLSLKVLVLATDAIPNHIQQHGFVWHNPASCLLILILFKFPSDCRIGINGYGSMAEIYPKNVPI